MTRTKTNKLIAILMAFFMAFAFMSFSLTYVNAAGENETPAAAAEETPGAETDSKDDESKQDESKQEENSSGDTAKPADITPNVKYGPTPDVSIVEKNYGAPDVNVIIDFGTDTPTLDYKNWSSTDNLKTIMDSIKVYSRKNADGQLENEVTISNKQLSDFKFENNKVTFTIPLSKANGLSATTTYYLSLGEALNAIEGGKGHTTFTQFATKTTTTSAKATTRTTYRTITTKATTVRAKSANTGDPSNLPVWIGLAVVAAILGGVVIVNKENE